MITENLSTLKIHKLTQEQYDRELSAGRIDESALYLTPEEEIDFPVDSVNGKTGDVILTASDVGAAAEEHTHSGLIFKNVGSTTLESRGSYAIAYGNGKYVAVPYAGTVSTGASFAYSEDGIVWTATSSPATAQWRAVTYGDDRFVAIGCGCAAYSTDGIAWTYVDIPQKQDYVDIAYGKGKFVAISQYGAIYSGYGTTWTYVEVPASAQWKSVTYGNGKFVAVSYQAPLTPGMYSTDGITWTTAIILNTVKSRKWIDVTYGNGKFVAITTTGTGAYSTDGIKWNVMSLPTSSYQYTRIVYGGGVFIVFTSDIVAYSIDGINWNIVQNLNGVRASQTGILTYGDGKFVGVHDKHVVHATIDNDFIGYACYVDTAINSVVTDVVYSDDTSPEAITAPLNADTLGGKLPSEFAPAGYGLGSGCKSVSSWNEATVTGWYYAKNDSIDGNYWFGMVVKHPNSEALTQTAYNHLTAIQTTRISVRGRDANGVWGAWEWVNPPMTLGVEYRTTERWNDSAVYTKLVNFGALPNNANKSISTGLTSNNIVRYYTTVNSGGKIFNLPYFMSNGTYKIKELVNSDGKYHIYTADDYSSANAVVQFWYIKS